MAIRLEHFARNYESPRVTTSTSRLQLAREALLGRVHVTVGEDRSALIHEVGGSISAIARRFEDLRFELVARRLQGKPLSPEEDAILGIINEALLESMPKSPPEPERVRVAVEEAEILLAQMRRG